MTALHPTVAEVTQRIIDKSRETRADYLRRMDAAASSRSLEILKSPGRIPNSLLPFLLISR